MDKNILPIAMKVCECATFTAAALGMEDAMDACRQHGALSPDFSPNTTKTPPSSPRE